MFTKGEWKVGYNPGAGSPTTSSFQPFSRKGWPYKTINVGTETIAIIPAPDTDETHEQNLVEKPNLIELQANANLIASAPDLYEACLSVLGAIMILGNNEGWVKEINKGWAKEMSGVIKKALAKAEGR